MNIFYVTSPFQYMCAEEAKDAYKTNNDVLILAIKDTEQGVKQLENAIDKTRWEHIIYYEGTSRTLYMPKLIKKLKALNKGKEEFNYFFYAEYTSWFVNFLKSNFKFEKQIYFDDGTLTIFEYEKYIKEKIGFSRKRLFQDILLKIQGGIPPNSVPYFGEMEIFTIFDLDDCGITIRKNNLLRVKAELPKTEYYFPNAPVGIIGMGSVGNRHYFSIEDYLNVIKQLSKQHEKLIYFPHRSESEYIKSKILEINNIQYHYSKYPIEKEIALDNIQISALYGVISTAFYTLSVLYPLIKIKRLPMDYNKLPLKVSESSMLVIEHAQRHILSDD